MKTNSSFRAVRFNVGVVLGLALCSVSLLRASAQIGGGGTTNYIPLWTSSVDLGNSNIYQSGIKLGIGTINPQGALDVRDASDFFAIQGANSRAGGIGVAGTSGASHNGVGVYGISTNSTGFGVLGSNKSPGGIAIGGTAASGGIAIKGLAVSVSGTSSLLTERPLAVWGSTSQSNGVGLAGTADDGFGVLGINSSQDSAAGFFQNTATEGLAAGVEGETSSATGYGVYGVNTSGGGYGVYGVSTSGYGVYGTASTGVGILGACVPTGSNSCFNGTAGLNTSTSGPANGLWGLTQSPQGNAVYLVNSGGGNLIFGSQSDGGSATFYVQGNGGGYFGGSVQINGNLNVGGTLTKGGGSFKIDDPLDPANKYLSHSFVESPDMMNVYNGNVTTDENGSATVELPNYFEALNRDFRYQLTVIGQFAQAMVAEEISHNHFTIRTTQPSVKVSWQVTGIRQDAWANAHRIPTEEDKPAEKRGTYLYPELYDASADKNTDAKSQQ